MRKVYTNQSIALAGAMRSYLQEQQIESEVRNEYSVGALGDLPFFDAWPELWVADESYFKATKLLGELEQQTSHKPEWFCQKCQELNPGNFEICWNCQS